MLTDSRWRARPHALQSVDTRHLCHPCGRLRHRSLHTTISTQAIPGCSRDLQSQRCNCAITTSTGSRAMCYTHKALLVK